MRYYHICPECGAALDPGEYCDCKSNNREDTNKKEDTQKDIPPMDCRLITLQAAEHPVPEMVIKG